ncbi:hypothetical protein WJX74_005335 [Apatococcus lobatus]|uniref:Immediate early response 3-interacting protein 1 n=2 Tax=Apatococcus TaxID=904362 RepID=A0AAW1RQU0_9CHLO
MISLWTLLQASILFANGLAVLNNERFLEKNGWGWSQMHSNNQIGGGGSGPLKSQVIGLLHAVAYLQVPLIVFNSVVIFVKMIF